MRVYSIFVSYVENRSLSITRLKLEIGWNQKFLDYEIETDAISGWVDRGCVKYLLIV